MVDYAVRAVPWTRIALAAGLVVVLMELVGWNPWVLWPLEGTAVGLLAGAAAWCFDESAAAVVDVAPRGLAWRTTARGSAVAGLALVWSLAVWHIGPTALFGHRSAVLAQGLTAVGLGSAYAVLRRAWGDPVPGLLLATAAVPLTAAWALVRPLPHALPVFPYGDSSGDVWATSTTGWLLAALLGAGLLAFALTDVRWSITARG